MGASGEAKAAPRDDWATALVGSVSRLLNLVFDESMWLVAKLSPGWVEYPRLSGRGLRDLGQLRAAPFA